MNLLFIGSISEAFAVVVEAISVNRGLILNKMFDFTLIQTSYSKIKLYIIEYLP